MPKEELEMRTKSILEINQELLDQTFDEWWDTLPDAIREMYRPKKSPLEDIIELAPIEKMDEDLAYGYSANYNNNQGFSYKILPLNNNLARGNDDQPSKNNKCYKHWVGEVVKG